MGHERNHPKLLIVEGHDDLHSVVGLMRCHVQWPEGLEDAPVFVIVGRSADEILAPGYLTAHLKASHVEALGVMLDADEHSAGRFQRIRALCSGLFPELPETMDSRGLIVTDEDQKRFGVWVMPDNVSKGGLEAFLRFLVPKEDRALWQYACQAVGNARQLGARCRDGHVAKANLYTWLAWQDPPGYSPGIALTRRLLDPHAPYANAFVEWFRRLYQV